MSMNKILGAIKKADEDFGLIKNKDRILVGLSFGKDSMTLVEALRLYKMFSKKRYEIIAVNIDLGFEKQDISTVIKFFEKNNIEFHIEKSDPLIYEVLKLHIKNDHLPCSICSRMKKAAICKAAHKYKCNKVAFAHHNDDAIETLFMNMIHGGRMATFSPKTRLSKEKITLIRPMCYCEEKDISHTIKTSCIPVISSNCPNDKNTERENIKQLLNKLYKLYPESKNNFHIMLSNTEKQELWKKRK